MFNFEYFNPNPRGAITGDCVKRAIVVATGIDYHKLEVDMNRMKKHQGLAYNYKKNWEPYIMKVLGAKKIGYSTPYGQSSWHVSTIDQVLGDYPHLTFILCVSKHLIGIKNNTIYDLGDDTVRDKMVFNVYVFGGTDREVATIKYRLNNDYRPYVHNAYTMY